MIGIALCPSAPPVKRRRPVYWLEATAIVALGVSWLSKGEAILGDQRGCLADGLGLELEAHREEVVDDDRAAVECRWR